MTIGLSVLCWAFLAAGFVADTRAHPKTPAPAPPANAVREPGLTTDWFERLDWFDHPAWPRADRADRAAAAAAVHEEMQRYLVLT